MSSPTYESKRLASDEAYVSEQLRVAGLAPSARDDLKLTGLEVIAFMAMQIALPIACGLISSVLYDQFRRIDNAATARTARTALTEADGTVSRPVDVETLRKDAAATMVQQGIDKATAERLAADIVQRMTDQV